MHYDRLGRGGTWEDFMAKYADLYDGWRSDPEAFWMEAAKGMLFISSSFIYEFLGLIGCCSSNFTGCTPEKLDATGAAGVIWFCGSARQVRSRLTLSKSRPASKRSRGWSHS